MKKTIVALAFALIAWCAVADHNATQLDKLVLGLPAGWEAHISRTGFSRYGVPELFQMRLELPTTQFEYEIMPGDKRMIHPSLTLHFYAPLTEPEFTDFQRKVGAEGVATDQPPARTLLFAKTENYWIFSTQSPDQFRHPKEREIYRLVKALLSINRKE